MSIKKSSQILPLILSGGAGTRLWPLSREAYPKQFHRLFGEHTLFEGAVLRATAVLKHTKHAQNMFDTPAHIAVICNENHRFMAADQAQRSSDLPAHIYLEPVGRNTAPAIAAVAAHQIAQGRDPILLVLSADHYLPDTAAFVRAVQQATQLAEQGYLVTFGVKPTAPETGYGYIEAGERIVAVTGASKVARFIEKPNAAIAAELIKNPRYTWNSGMFVMRASVFFAELQIHAPQIGASMQTAAALAEQSADFIRFDSTAFQGCPAQSVDYAVFEHSQNVATLTLDMAWSDMGTWAAVAALSTAHGETGLGKAGHAVVLEGHSNYIHANKTVTLIGVSNVSVVDTVDALLVVQNEASQAVKQAVASLQKTGLQKTTEYTHHSDTLIQHRLVHKPWGWYEGIEQAESLENTAQNTNKNIALHQAKYQVKHLHVKPGQSLSLQSHTHRAEHWVVIAGVASITVAPKGVDVHDAIAMVQYCKDYTVGQHVDIAIGEVHRLENRTTQGVDIIEVQFGTYLGEDDIVRYADVYARA